LQLFHDSQIEEISGDVKLQKLDEWLTSAASYGGRRLKLCLPQTAIVKKYKLFLSM